jgi:Bacterial Ig domain
MFNTPPWLVPSGQMLGVRLTHATIGADRWAIARPSRRSLTFRDRLSLTVISVAALSALSGLLVGPPPQARAALVATGVPDRAAVRHDRTVVAGPPGVLGNDLNLLGGTTAIQVSDVSHGSLALRSNGGFTYAPDSGFVGTDSFRYRPSGLLSTAATVTITVTNAAPVARPDAYTWPAGTTLIVAAPGVLANDTDADGDELIADLVGGGISGSFDLGEDGSIRYTPGGGFSGSGTVSYRVWDGVAWSAPTTISLTRQSPTPTPTPAPTPNPTPTPTPTPPSIPLPVPVPLPSLPVPLPSLGLPPGPGPEPTGPPSSSVPRPSPGSSRSNDEPAARPREVDDGNAAPVVPPVSQGGSGDGPGGSGGAVEDGDGAPIGDLAPRVDFAELRLDLRPTGLNLLAGVEIWSVPAATLAVPGILLIIWVGLQAVGALAWIPAVRRLRGDGEPELR